MTLTQKQKKTLRNLSHDLKPVVMIGQHGLTENVVKEIDLSIEHHELIKVRVNAADREQRATFIQQIADRTQSQVAHTLGHTAVFYRRNPKLNRIQLAKK